MDRTTMVNTLKDCTGLLNTEECTQIMENHNWDLEAAVDFVLNIMQPSITENPIADVAPTPPRSITLDIIYNDLRNKIIVNSTDDIGKMKELIVSIMNVNWEEHEIASLSSFSDTMSVGDVFPDNFASLMIKNRRQSNRHNNLLEIRFMVHTPRIRTRAQRNGSMQTRRYNIKLSPSINLEQAKLILCRHCGVSPERQRWEMEEAVSKTAEIQSYLNSNDTVNVYHREHSDSPMSVFVNSSTSTMPYHDERTENDSEEYITLSDESIDNGVLNTNRNNTNSLLPLDCSDEARGIEIFAQNLADKYGPSIPVMYIGSLENAIQDSLLLPIKDRRLLAIYIHNAKSICVNVFCKHILMNECLTAFLPHHYIMWPWDFTQESNRRWFLSKALMQFGSQITTSIEELSCDRFPVILILSRGHSTIESLGLICGSDNCETVMTKMTLFAEQFDKTREDCLAIELERQNRNLIREEQDRAYQNSLNKDKEKAIRIKQEALLQNQKDEEEQAKKQAILNLQREMELQLPEEPDLNDDNICFVRIRLPSGQCACRRFYSSDSLKVIFTFLGSKGYFIKDCKLLTAYPRKDIASNDPDSTLAEAGIHSKELLTVEYR